MILNLTSRLLKHKAAPGIFGLIAAVLVLRCLWLWQPSRQVQLHQEHFLDAAQERNWKRFSLLVSPQYSDRWHHDKTSLLNESSEVLRQFFGLTIKRDLVDRSVNADHAKVTMRLKLEGKGTAIAEIASSSINALTQPFSFEWKRQSWKPWDWVLVSADQPELHLDQTEGF